MVNNLRSSAIIAVLVRHATPAHLSTHAGGPDVRSCTRNAELDPHRFERKPQCDEALEQVVTGGGEPKPSTTAERPHVGPEPIFKRTEPHEAPATGTITDSIRIQG